MKQKATLGRIVHYVDGSGQHCAAIVSAPSATDDGPVCMHVLRPWSSGVEAVYTVSATYSEKPAPYTWHWPERE